MTTTVIRNADWVVAWDADAARHVYRQGIDVAFTDDRLIHVGPSFAGEAQESVDGRGLMVMPGLIDIHAHPFVEPFYRGIREEHGVPEMHMTGLYERGQAYKAPPEDMATAAEVAYCELLLSGVTTLADVSADYPGWLELVARSGLRAVLSPGFASSHWYMDNRHQLKFAWDEARGRDGMDAALALIDRAAAHPSGRLSGMVCPMQIDTCTAELLADAFAAAKERGLPFTTHASQSVTEFLIMTDRHGKTPLQYAHDLGLLDPITTIAHAIFVDEHSWITWHSRDDVRLLAESGTTVAHCPTPFVRYGHVLESFGRYQAAGVNMGMGTDTAPHNLIEEMRYAIILGRVAARDIRSVGASDVFHAATVGGAKALLRDDIGRLAIGAKADVVLVDCMNAFMRPARDPLRSLIYTAADRAVRDVYVDGRLVVKDHAVLTLDHAEALDRLTEAQARIESAVPQHDYAGRSSQEIAPLSLPLA